MGDDEFEFTVDELGGDEPLTPGSIDLENAVFFVLGVAFAVALIAAMVM